MRLVSFIVLTIFFLQGCATVDETWDDIADTFDSDSTEEASPKMGNPAAGRAGDQLPLKIKIDNEINDGKELHVLASVKAQKPWPAGDVAARLSGLRDGKEVVHSQKGLAELLGIEPNMSLSPGKPVTVSLSIPSEGLTDYQIELLWGEAAKSGMKPPAPATAPLMGDAPAQPKPPGAPGTVSVSLQKLHVDAAPAACSAPPCGVSFEISGELVNKGTVAIQSLVLGVGFLPRGSGVDLSPRIPENEELVEVSGIQLTPGARRPIHLVIDRPLSLEQADRYRPVVRIVEVNQ